MSSYNEPDMGKIRRKKEERREREREQGRREGEKKGKIEGRKPPLSHGDHKLVKEKDLMRVPKTAALRKHSSEPS